MAEPPRRPHADAASSDRSSAKTGKNETSARRLGPPRSELDPSFHKRNCPLNGGVYSQIARIQQDRIVGLPQGGGFTVGVTLVARLNVVQHSFQPAVQAHALQLVMTPLRTHIRTCGDEELRIGLRRDDSAYITSIKHRAAGLPGKGSLPVGQCRTHRWMRRDARRRCAGRFRFEFGIAKHGLAEITGGESIFLIRRIAAPAQRCKADGSVEQPRVQMWKTEMACQGAGDRALAGCRGTIDGYDHDSRDPSVTIICSKPGKLVATGAMSSIVTGWREDSPAIAKLIAMR